ncbi:MAG: hypothetical protein GF334_11875 [Candidatus Altiarchaeales archaeon]|nr:hypothetical protein [Candidatus Altiarchaeales archaeon]
MLMALSRREELDTVWSLFYWRGEAKKTRLHDTLELIDEVAQPLMEGVDPGEAEDPLLQRVLQERLFPDQVWPLG